MINQSINQLIINGNDDHGNDNDKNNGNNNDADDDNDDAEILHIGLELNNPAVVSISSPIFVAHATRSTICWVQLVLLRAECVSLDTLGIMWVAGKPLFSRERAEDRLWSSQWEGPEPSLQFMRAGQFHRHNWRHQIPAGTRIFYKVPLQDLWNKRDLPDGLYIRFEDFTTLTLIKDLLYQAAQGTVIDYAQVRFPINHPDAQLEAKFHWLAQQWNLHLGALASDPWPMIATTKVYATFYREDWRMFVLHSWHQFRCL